MSTPDYIIVGSGINGLVAAAILGRRGKRILLLERNAGIGGCMRSEAIIAPGFVHDVMATTFVLFLTSPAYAVLADDLGKRGLVFCHSDWPSGVLLPDGRAFVLTMNRAANIAALDQLAAGDGAVFADSLGMVGRDAPLLFALLGGALWKGATARLLLQEAWRRGGRGLAAFFGEALVTARAWLEAGFRSEVAQAMFAPWVLHAGLGPEAAYSGQMGKVIAFALEAAGAPIVQGGAVRLLDAFQALITDRGGEIRVNADVASIRRDGTGAACGVSLGDGTELAAAQGVICSVAPAQLYGRLIEDSALPADIKTAVASYRHGKGNMQIHYALKRPPQWRSARGAELGRVALLHLTPGLDGVSRAANECERGLLPAVPTVCVGQPHALDPSRCPPGSAILWLQLPEVPRFIKGDAAGEIPAPADGRWSAGIRERFADRIEAILVRHIENFSQSVIGRKCYSPADLEQMNINLVGGDPYGGNCGIDQFFLWRPFKHSINHKTHIPRLYHIGASTHPGPGLGGGSGFIAANDLP
jgi:phytoene dehydrogenase-like protein